MTFQERLEELEVLAIRVGVIHKVDNIDPYSRASALADVLGLALPDALDPDLPLITRRGRIEINP
ncbi:MAG: hypothetical protein DRH08_01525 [Deltaproteobacteria bacterium]|nr:MAG: hypothetical protein DRH08_01525 [Deltaproteobacteria bacterium]